MNQYEDFQDFDEVKPSSSISKIVPVVSSQNQIKSSPQNANLYTALDRGDVIIQRAHHKAVILVGLSRKGKSTVFNWILGRSMKGQAKKEGEQAYYVSSVENDRDSAKVGNTFSSVTLAPNLYVDFVPRKIGKNGEILEQGVSLVDMAGYEDKRNYIGVIGVSYFLKEVFQRVKKAKFIVVLSDNMFEESSGEGIISTFRGFLNMFNYRQMTKQIRAQLRKSIVVVVTKAKSPISHYYDKLQIVISKIKEEDFKLENKGAYVQILSWLHKTERIQDFKAAVPNRIPQKCTFVQKKSTNPKDPWEFINLDQVEILMQKPPIALPFKRDFEILKEDQMRQFETVIEARVKAYEGFVAIIATLLRQFTQNWHDFLKTYPKQPKATFNYGNLNSLFDQIKAYNKVNDLYTQNSLREYQLKVSYQPLTFIQAIRQILNVFEQIIKITSTREASFQINMNIFATEYPVIVDSLKKFARNNQDYQELHKLNYILNRGFKEFKRLFQLKDSLITDANQKLRDYFTLNKELDSKKQQFALMIIRNMKTDLIIRLFPTLDLTQKYQEFFNQYYSNGEEKDYLFLKEHRQSIQMVKADFFLRKGDKSKALLCYIRIFFIFQQISDLKQNSASYSLSQKEQSLNELSMKKLKVIRKIVAILKVLPSKQGFSPIDQALRLCQHNKMMQDICQIYQSIIDSPSTSEEKKLAVYYDYANYIASWGDVDLAINLLRKSLQLEENYQSYQGTIQMIKKLNTERINFYREFGSNLSTINRLPITDQTLNNSLKNIEYWVVNP